MPLLHSFGGSVSRYDAPCRDGDLQRKDSNLPTLSQHMALSIRAYTGGKKCGDLQEGSRGDASTLVGH